MSVAKLETEMLKVRKELQGVKKVNTNFCKILDELNTIKANTQTNQKLKDKITQEFRDKEIIDIFAGIEQDFQDLRNQLSKQELNKERVADFVESLRTRKTFSFEETTKSILFLESVFSELHSDIISLRPQFVGTIDLGEIAIELGLHKTGSAIVVQQELLNQVFSLLISKRMFRNIVFETSNAKISLKSSNEIVVESDNLNIRKISRLRD